MALTQTQVSQLYVSIFGRASEGEGNTYYQGFADQKTAADDMFGLSVVLDYFGITNVTDSANVQKVVETVYLNALGKTSTDDPDGIAYWVSEVTTGGKTMGDMVSALVNSAVDSANAGTAQDTFNNKVAASDYAAANLTAFTDFATFQSYISSVDSTSASLDAAKAAIDGDVPSTVTGETFTLTDSTTDKPAMTTENDVVNGPAGTLQDTDIITDSTTTDSDVMNFDLWQNQSPDVSGVETLNVEVRVADTTLTASTIEHTVGATLNFASATNVRDIDIIDNLNEKMTLNFSSGTWTGTTGGAINIDSSGPLASLQTTSITLNGTTLQTELGGTTNADDIDSLTLTSSGSSANTLDFIGNANADINEGGESITLKGSQDITFRGDHIVLDGLVVVESGFTGSSTVRVDAINTAAALNLSNTNADTVRIDADNTGNAITLSSGMTLDMRVAQTTELELVTSASQDSTSDTLTIKAQDTAANGALDMVALNLTGAQGFEIVNLVGNGPSTISAAHDTGAITGQATNGTQVNISGSDMWVVDTLDANILGLDGSSLTSTGKLTVNTLVTNTNKGDEIKAGASTIDTLGEVTDDGGAGVTADLSTGVIQDNVTATNKFTISGFERVQLSDGNDVVTGSSGADRIEGGSGADTMDGKSGADVYFYGAAADSDSGTVTAIAADATSTTIKAAGIDLVTFVDGSDKININALTGGTAVTVNNGGVAGGIDYDATTTVLANNEIYVFGQIGSTDVSSDGLYIGQSQVATTSADLTADFDWLIYVTGVSDASKIDADDFIF
jgi:hypothetical protein